MLATGSCLSRVEATTSGTANSTRETMNTTPNPVTPPGSTTPPGQQASAPRPPAGDGGPAVASGPLTEARRDQGMRLVAAAAAEDRGTPPSEHGPPHLRYDGVAPRQA